MPESGSAVLTAVLNKLGVSLPANPINDPGANGPISLTSSKVRDLNDEVLASAGSSRDDFTPFHEDWLKTPIAKEFVDRAVSVLEDEFGNSALFCLEDSAICRMVPFWTKALTRFGCSLHPILIVRNPLELGEALKATTGWSEPAGQMIWLRHALDAERATRGRPRLHTSFEQLMLGWEAVAEKAQEELQLVWPKPIANVEFEVEGIVGQQPEPDPKNSQARALTSTLLPDWVREGYKILNGWAIGEEMSAHQKQLDAIKAEFDNSSRAFARLVRAEHQHSLEEIEKASKEAEFEALQAEILALNAQVETASLTAVAERAAAAEQIDALKAALQDQRRTNTLMNGELHQLRETRQDIETQLRDAHEEIAASRARRKEMARVINNREAKIASLTEEMQTRYQELALLERYVLRFSPTRRLRQLMGWIKRRMKRAFGQKPATTADMRA
jgi:hypothetical protein